MIRSSQKLFCTALAIVLLAGTGFCEDTGRVEEDDRVVLGEEDLAERAEIARNMFRRITPGDEPFVQDVGTWPVAWEEFPSRWAGAAMGREYGAWVVPFSLVQESGATVIRDANETVLWRGETDFAKPESASVTLIGGLVAEEDWAAYEGVRNWVETNARLDDTPSRGATYTNGLRFTSLAIDTNGTVELSLAWEEDGDVDIFAYLLSGIPSTNVATWTNDENQVVTTTNTVWEIIGENLSGFDNAWEWRGMASVTNGEGFFTDSGAAANPVRMGFYAAAEANDTDGDGLNDGFESFVHHTDPENTDSDGDGEPDGTDPYPGTSNVFWVVKTTNNLFRQVGLGIYTNSPSIPRPVLTNLPVSGTAPTTDSVVLDICITGYVDDAIRVDANGVDWGQDTQRFYHRSITNEVSSLQSRQFNLELWDWPRDNFTNQANEVRLGWSTTEQFEVEWTWKVPVCVTGADFVCVGDTAQMGVSWEAGGPYSWSVTGSAASIDSDGLLIAVTSGVAIVTATDVGNRHVEKEVVVLSLDLVGVRQRAAPCNRVPNPKQRTHERLFVATENSGAVELEVLTDIHPYSQQTNAMCAIHTDGDCLASAPVGVEGIARLAFVPAADIQSNLFVRVGIDANGDGILDIAEARTTATNFALTVFTDNWYGAQRADLDSIPDLKTKLACPLASSLLVRFLDRLDEHVPFSNITNRDINCFTQSNLTHNTGAEFSMQGTGRLELYEWPEGGTASERISESSELARIVNEVIAAHAGEICGHFLDYPGSNVYCAVWSTNGAPVNFEETSLFADLRGFDLHMAFGHARFTSLAVDIRVESDSDGGLSIGRLEVAGMLEDLYDFDWEEGTLNTMAAVLQIGWDSSRDERAAGNIFFDRVHFRHVFNSWEYDF